VLPNLDELTSKIKESLLKSGIAVGELTRASPDAVDNATSFVIGKIPALRFVPGGRKKARELVLAAIGKLPKASDEERG
jgi:hypothetical protein